MSSGIYATDWDMDCYCRICMFEGLATVTVDKEDRTWYWDCPVCGHEYDGEGVPRLEDQL